MRRLALVLFALTAVRASAESLDARMIRESGDWLLGEMKEVKAADPKAAPRASWPQFDAHEFSTDSLYSGNAGVLLTLLTLHEFTGEARFADAARRCARQLVAVAQPDGAGVAWDIAWDDAQGNVHTQRSSSLYSGSAGIAWALLVAGDMLTEPDFTATGRRGMDAIAAQLAALPGGPAGKFWDNGSLDIISGTAGISLALLDAWTFTGEKKYRDAAIAGADGLLSAAVRAEDGWSWPARAGEERIYSGFSHGVAGIGYTLARVAAATGEDRFLDAARQAARWLEREAVCVRNGAALAWKHHVPAEKEQGIWEGWCHGPSGTCRLHLYLYSLTGEAKYLESAEAGAKWLLAVTKPDAATRGEAGFFAPSLCCGAAGAGMYALDLYRFTGETEYLDYAQKVGGFLDRIADRPAAGKACWSLTGQKEDDGKVYHGTCLMVGEGGYIAFYARLAQESRRVVREVVLPPDMATVGAPPGKRLLVVEYGEGAQAFRRSARRLAQFRGGEWTRLEDSASWEALRDLVRARRADAVALAVAPGTFDINLNRRVLFALAAVDTDPLPDATIGYLTGGDPDVVRAMLDAMGVVEATGIKPRGVDFGIATGMKDVTRYENWKSEAGIKWDGVFLPTVEECPGVRGQLKDAAAFLKDTGAVAFSGNGDPMRMWLFAGERNFDPKLHWPFEPAKICRDYADKAMTGLGAADFASWDLAGRVVWCGTCHSAVTARALIAGDIVSTFGETGGVNRFYVLKPAESLALAILARGPAAFVAPVGANHGFRSIPEVSWASRENLSMGEVVRRNSCEVALAVRKHGAYPLVQQEEGKAEVYPPIDGSVMTENTLNRVLFGDPTFQPFSATSPRVAAISVRVQPRADEGPIVALVTVADPAAMEYVDQHRGALDASEHVFSSVPLPAGFRVAGVKLAVKGATLDEVVLADWMVEDRRGLPPLLWFSVNAAAGKEPSVRVLWKTGVELRLEIATVADVGGSGEMKKVK